MTCCNILGFYVGEFFIDRKCVEQSENYEPLDDGEKQAWPLYATDILMSYHYGNEIWMHLAYLPVKLPLLLMT